MTTATVARFKTLDLIYISLFAVLISVCSWISVPATIPFTMQTFGVFLTGGLLGPRRGVAAVFIYLLLGLVGLPVFAGFTGGPGILLSPPGGYLVGFLGAALVTGLTARSGRKTWVLALGMLAGLLICYAFGTAWFMAVYARNTGPIGLAAALSWCVIPFVIPDLLKIIAACALTNRLGRYIK